MSYVHGKSLAAKDAREAADRIANAERKAKEVELRAAQKLAELIKLEVEIEARKKGAQQLVARAERRASIKAQKASELETELEETIRANVIALALQNQGATYRPTKEALAYWENFKATNTNPFGDSPSDGPRRLRQATAEAAHFDASRRGKRQDSAA